MPTDAGVTDLAGLAGLRIAVVPETSLAAQLTEELTNAGITFEAVPTQVGQQPSDLVDSGDADAYAAFWIQGIVGMSAAGNMVVLPLAFDQGLAVFTSPTEPEFGAMLDEQLQNLIDSGVWAAEFEKAFGFAPPWTVEEMAAAG